VKADVHIIQAVLSRLRE